MPASRWIRSAVISGEMRALARGPSGMLIAVDAALAERAALGHGRGEVVAARAAPARRVVTHWPLRPAAGPAAISRPAARAASAAAGLGRLDHRGRSACRPSGLIARAISRMCSGVVPQQPPTPDTPRLDEPLGVFGQILGRAEVDPPVLDFLGDAGVGLDHQRQRGDADRPLDGARAGRRARCRSSCPRRPAAAQSAGSGASIRFDRLAGGRFALADEHEREHEGHVRAGGAWRRRSVPGRPGVGCVSKRMKSAPPSRRLAACSTIIVLDRVSAARGGGGSGPIEPATSTGRPAASATRRAMAAPARLISRTFSASP